MKTLTLSLLAFLLFVGGASAFDWTAEDTRLEIAYQVLNFLDWGQTLDIADNPDKYYEMNRLLGRHPSRGKVNLFMTANALLHPLIVSVLPRRAELFGYEFSPRGIYQGGSIAVKVGCVGRNFSIGLAVNF